MKFYSIRPSNKLWKKSLSFFSSVNRDIFYTQEFAELAQNTIYKDYSVKCLIAYDNDNYILCPIIERNFIFKKKKYTDITSPYNLGGPICNKANEKLKKFFNEKLIKYCKEKEVLNFFLRFHPILKNTDIINKINVSSTGKYAIVNLKKITQPLIKNFEYRHQKSIKKAIKNKVEIIISNNEEYLNNFFEIYFDEMKFKKASKFYFFEKEFFYKLKKYLKNNYQFFYAKYEEKIISCELVINNETFCHSYLGATNHDYKNICSNHLLKSKIIEFFHLKGFQYFFLGGSQSNDDGIFKYKSGFANEEILNNKIGKIILNNDDYLELKETFEKKYPKEDFKKLQFYENYLLK